MEFGINNPQVQDRSPDLLICSPTRHYCATAAHDTHTNIDIILYMTLSIMECLLPTCHGPRRLMWWSNILAMMSGQCRRFKTGLTVLFVDFHPLSPVSSFQPQTMALIVTDHCPSHCLLLLAWSAGILTCYCLPWMGEEDGENGEEWTKKKS